MVGLPRCVIVCLLPSLSTLPPVGSSKLACGRGRAVGVIVDGKPSLACCCCGTSWLVVYVR